jgi:gamma-glutamyltranspeptidase/glutathione hydrolase
MIHTPYATRGMVVAPHHVAAQAGLAILREGGNAVEAAVATAAVLCVVYPHMTGLGGDGFWLIAEPGRAPVAIDACGRSARAATPELFHKAGLSAIPWRGPLAAITVAGAVSGWAEALQLAQGFGGKALPLSRLLEDARYLARNGMVVTRSQATLTAAKLAELAPQPGFAAQFLALDQPPSPGTRLTLPALADTLDRLAQAGLDDFYHGEVAKALAHDLTHVGSPLRAEDLAAQRALVTTPLRCSLPGVNLYNLPPPTQGLASLMMLGIFSRLKVRHAESFEHLHGLIEAAKLAFAIRDRIIGDPDCMTESPAPYVTDQILDDLAGRIAMDQAAPSLQREADAGDTVWFGVIDANGRAVSCIQSIFFEFGSGVVLPETGVTWQNRGIAFQLTKGRPRSLEPGRKPYHTLNPAMARFADGRTMVYGTMGGEGQPQTQAALFTRYALYGKGLQAAITAPRWVQGRTWGGETVSLKMENRFDPDLVDHLRRVGHRVEVVEPFAHMMGHAGAIVRHPDHIMEGGADPRGDGVVAGW